MPTNRGRRTRGKTTGAGGITEADYYYFAWGPFFDAENYETGKTKTGLKAFWKKHREAILDRYFRDGRHAGQRPWPIIEWELEPKHPRLKVGTQEYWGPWQKGGQPKKPEILDVMETDEEYLERLGLLEGWEITALKRGKKGGTTDERT
jgi:hypothetical protein